MARSSAPESSSAPKQKKRRWYHQLWAVFRMTQKSDPALVWWMALAFFGVLAVAFVLGFFLTRHMFWYWIVISIPLGLLGAMIVLSRRAETAAYGRLEGQPGAVSAALGTIKRGWAIEEEPVAIDPRTQAMVFRLVGRPGVVLVGEGGTRGVQQRLLEQERKRVTRLTPDVPVHLLQCGREEGQVPLPSIAAAARKFPRRLTSQEVSEVQRRLNALAKVRMPIPKGIDPTRMRPDRKGMRGR